MVKRLDRYIGRAAVLGIIAVWVTLNVLAMLFNLLSELRSTEGGYGALDVLWFVIMTSPRTAYQVFPVCALIGALIGVGGLAASNELVALRTSGVSRLRIAGSALAGTLLVTVAVVFMGEWILPGAEQKARVFRMGEKLGQVVIGGPKGIWLRDGKQIVNIERPLLFAKEQQQSVEFRNVAVFTFAGGNRLAKITRAGRATHDDEQWQLEEVSDLVLGETGIDVRVEDQRAWQSSVRPELLDDAVTRPVYLSVRALRGQIDYLDRNGLDARIHRSALYAKVFYPLSILALVLAGMPFVFGQARHHNLGVRVFVGMTGGAVFTIVNNAARNFGDAYSFPAILSASVPSLLLAAAAIAFLRRGV
ncbi:MAG: LPS export ABC transporter permease LptG [Xanthomonadales bacterium]|nr:LPS export ABC transporter permease LptG [Xanthomonadales bacterium]NIN59581.1 LPS export ABC transporter permease LptG [Xanthomonadales bacterium]NIN74968.1 LPS export ABC transporter permease LptG [Xanthomonadales bacterium]NIO12668.1 LPS export ABC transporter permease LptG [Xanthomonadales bacterium]NIP11974.1 LPS export ABC transporter permease LptG [Xanthomonadales bacterium]